MNDAKDVENIPKIIKDIENTPKDAINVEPKNENINEKIRENQKNPKKKIAIIITGFLRSFNYNNLKEVILDVYHPDVFLHLSADEQKEDRYMNKNISISEICNLLNPKIMIYEHELLINTSNTYKMWYKINKMCNLLSEYEDMTGDKYDIIIRYRPDMYFLEPLSLNLEKEDFSKVNNSSVNYFTKETSEVQVEAETETETETGSIIIPLTSLVDKSNDMKHAPICDIFAFGPAGPMKKYCKMFEYLTKESNITSTNTFSNQNYIPEVALRQYLDTYSIPYTEYDIKYKVILSLCNIIGICGDSGSGKTHLSNLLLPIFGGMPNTLKFECDRYHKWERGHEEWIKTTHLNPNANYLCKMRDDCFDLKIGKDIYQVDYDHKTGKFTSKERVQSKDTVILCGLHTFSCEKTNKAIDIKIFIDTDKQLQNVWKSKRDVLERGYSLEKVLNTIKNRELDASLYIHPQKEMADLIINYFMVNNVDKNYLDVETLLSLNPIINLRLSFKSSALAARLSQLLVSVNVKFNKIEDTCLEESTRWCVAPDIRQATSFLFDSQDFSTAKIYDNILKHFNKASINTDCDLLPPGVEVILSSPEHNKNLQMGFDGLIQCIVLFMALSPNN